MRKAKVETFASVWDALADTPEEAANLRLRSALMQQIAAIVKHRRFFKAKAQRFIIGGERLWAAKLL